MTRWAYVARVFSAGAWAMFRAILSRARRGPTVASWTWSEELFVAFSRATATASAQKVALMTPTGLGLRPPLRRAQRDARDVECVDLRGVRAERLGRSRHHDVRPAALRLALLQRRRERLSQRAHRTS